MQVKPGADTTGKFSFDDQAMPRAYDERLVPVMFEPWATRLVETMGRGRPEVEDAGAAGSRAGACLVPAP